MKHELTSGTKIIFTPTGAEFVLKAVTEKRVTWYTGFIYKGGCGKNQLSTAGTSRTKFENGINNGTYIIIN